MGVHFHPSDLRSIELIACVLAIFGIFQFLLLIVLAMIFYPGGYDFFRYYLSDLGTMRARNREPNPISSALFSVTFTILGLSLIPFWIIIHRLFAKSTSEKIFSVIGSVMGFLSTPFVIGVVLYPMDTQFSTHEFFAQTYTLVLALAILFFSVAMVLNQNYPNYVAVISFGLFIIIGVFGVIGFGEFQTLMQKIIFSGFILWVLIQIFRIWQLIKPEQFVSSFE
ncbi:MAG: DUF998 domain-containing protein [Candidatus Hodarchaeota archaeon]